MFRGMKSLKLSGGAGSGWTWENAVAKESVDLRNVNSRYDSYSNGVQISDDGHYLYIGFWQLKVIAQFYLSTAGDLSTITTTVIEKSFPHEFNTFKIAKGGERLYINLEGADRDIVRQYDFSTAWDIESIGGYVSQESVINDDGIVEGLDVSLDGTQLFAISNNQDLYAWSMPTPFELQGGASSGPVSINLEDSINFSSDGKRIMSVRGEQGDFASKWDIGSTYTDDPLNPYATQGDFGYGMDITPDGKNAFCKSSSSPVITRVELAPGGSYGKSVPVADAGDDQYEIVLDATVQLNGSGSYDTNTPPKTLSYIWSLPTIPGGSTAVLSDPNIVNPTFVLDVEGDYIASLIVSNGFESSSPSTTTVTSSALGVTARYWGVKNLKGVLVRTSQIEFVAVNNGMALTEFDTTNVIYDLPSYGHTISKSATNRDWGTNIALDPDTFLKYDCGVEQTVSFIRIGINDNTSKLLEPFSILKSDDDVNWYESDIFSGYTADAINQFNSGNYIDITNTNWTLI
ncbi:MAG: hypothetical protein DRG30_06335 [Epsilonproteobacteria bacterium]|nr:MAG: hypothetical protein DRG30_06335 [Campylobacterota bacterium]